MQSVIQFIVFQLVWLACALSDPWDMPWLGPSCTLVYLKWASTSVPRVWQAAAGMALLGLTCETALMHGGFISYATSYWPSWLAPAWMVALWAAFAVPTMTTFSWLAGRPWLGALLGGLGGTMAYIGGQTLGALRIGEPTWSCVLAVAGLWSLVVPVTVPLGQRFLAPTQFAHRPDGDN